MGAGDSRSRSVSYGLDEQDNVTVLQGVKVTPQHIITSTDLECNYVLQDTIIPLYDFNGIFYCDCVFIR